MLSFVAALAFLIAIGAVGVAALRRAGLCLNPLEQVAYGMPAGAVATSLAMLPLCILFGLTTGLVLIVGVVASGLAFLLLPNADYPSLIALREEVAGRRRQLRTLSLATVWRAARRSTILIPALVIGALAVRWVFFFRGALDYTASGLVAGHEFIWSDWGTHLSDTVSFAWGDNFPPENPRLPGNPFAYHYLAAFTAATLVKLGLGPVAALSVASCFFSIFIALGLFAFARRLIGHSGAATLAVILFLFGSSLGWLLTAADVDFTHDLWLTLTKGNPWRYGRLVDGKFNAGIPWIFRLASERGYTFGLPLSMLTLTLLQNAIQTGRRRIFAAAGVVVGMLPLAHLSSLTALALITPALVLLSFPFRGLWQRPFRLREAVVQPLTGWFLALVIAGALAVPQLYSVLGGGRGAAGSLRTQVGWIAAPDPWWWFWLKNLGLFFPLLGLALADRRLVAPSARRFLWAFMPVFVIANLIVFQPWDGDNTKIFMYWFLGTCVLVAALLGKAWREHGDATVRVLISGAVLTMTLNGFIGSFDQALGEDRWQILSRDELLLADLVREQTPQDAIFVAGLQGNHTISMLTGRVVVMSFPGWAWAYGIPDPEREQDVRNIYHFVPDTPALLRKYNASYVVIGPFERNEMAANESAFRARYPVVIQTATYEVFDVRDGDGSSG